MDGDLLRYAERVYGSHFDQQGGRFADVFLEHGYYGNGGLGSVLKGIWSFIRPAVTSIGRTALGSAGNFLGDVASGRNWKESGKERAKEALHNILTGQRGSGGRRRPLTNKELHNAVKLFSFYPSSAGRRRAPTTRRRRRATSAAARKRSTTGRVTKRRRRRTTAAGGARRRRRRTTAGTTRRRRRAAPARRGRRRAAPARKRRRRVTSRALVPVGAQQGSGFYYGGGGDDWL